MRHDPNLTVAQLNAIYDVLVKVCGVVESNRTGFLFDQSKQPKTDYDSPWPTEWRFGGALGFGGKFWRNSGRVYVDCYQEDETPKRLEIIQEANRQIQAILE